MLIAQDGAMSSSGIASIIEHKGNETPVSEIRHQAEEDGRPMVTVDKLSRSLASNIFPERSFTSVCVRWRVTLKPK
jgi:hypothetical protein